MFAKLKEKQGLVLPEDHLKVVEWMDDCLAELVEFIRQQGVPFGNG